MDEYVCISIARFIKYEFIDKEIYNEDIGGYL